MEEQQIEGVMDWVVKHFGSARYEHYLERDGSPRYLLVERKKMDGFTEERLISVRSFSEMLAKEVPNYSMEPLEEVVASMKHLSQERGYDLEPLLQRAS